MTPEQLTTALEFVKKDRDNYLAIIGQVQRDFGWMVDKIKKLDEDTFGEHSIDLKHAIALRKLLDVVEVPEHLK